MKLGLLFTALLAGLAMAKPISFEDRPDGAVLMVKIESNGCFHNSTSYFEFRGNTVQVWELIAQPGKDEPAKKRDLGTLKLSKSDLDGLELLLDYYQGGPDGGCTTIETIKLTLEKDGKIITTENHVDGSCAASDIKGVLSLWELHQRAAKSIGA